MCRYHPHYLPQHNHHLHGTDTTYNKTTICHRHRLQHNDYLPQTSLTTQPPLATDITTYNTATTCLTTDITLYKTTTTTTDITVYNTTTTYHRHHSVQHNHHLDITVYNTTTIYHRLHSTTQPPTTDITVYNLTTIYHRQHHLQH